MLDFKFPDPCVGLSESTSRKPTGMLFNRPPTPAAHSLGIEYEPTFDSDDEYITDDNCSLASRKISFCQRPRPLSSPLSPTLSDSTAKKVVSLLTLELERYRESAANAKGDEPLTDEEDLGVSQPTVNLQALDNALADALGEQDGVFPEQPPRLQLAVKQQPPPIARTELEAPPRQTGLLTTLKKLIVTNLTRCGTITRLRHKQQQPTRSRTTIPRTTNDGEQDPYFLFFGDNQDRQPIIPHRKTQEQQPAAAKATSCGSSHRDPPTHRPHHHPSHQRAKGGKAGILQPASAPPHRQVQRRQPRSRGPVLWALSV